MCVVFDYSLASMTMSLPSECIITLLWKSVGNSKYVGKYKRLLFPPHSFKVHMTMWWGVGYMQIYTYDNYKIKEKGVGTGPTQLQGSYILCERVHY